MKLSNVCRHVAAIFAGISLTLIALPASAQGGLDSIINNAVQPATELLSSIVFFKATVFGVAIPLVVVWLAFAALFFTVYFNFINVRGLAHAFRLVRGDYSTPEDPGEVSHFQALTTAVSAPLV